MIQSLRIKNFQSHKDTAIEFHNGINAVVGSSDQGKSAVLRALLWAVNNRPSGTDDILSHWARDEKGKIIEGMAVGIRTNHGNVTRQRTEKDNEYVLFDSSFEGREAKIFKAINRDVPQDIQDFFRLTDVNIQTQHDAPFLLSASAGDVAKYFNKIVRLDIIDKVLSGVESKRRDQNKKIKTLEAEHAELEKELQSYDWIDTAEPLVKKFDRIFKQLEIDIYQKSELEEAIAEFRVARKKIKTLPDVTTAKKIISELETIEAGCKTIERDMRLLACDIDDWRDWRFRTKIWKAVGPGKKLVENLETIQKVIEDAEADVEDLENQIHVYREEKKNSKLPFDKDVANKIIAEFDSIRPDYAKLRELNDQINDWSAADAKVKKHEEEKELLTKSMPKTCPTCGQPMKGAKNAG